MYLSIIAIILIHAICNNLKIFDEQTYSQIQYVIKKYYIKLI